MVSIDIKEPASYQNVEVIRKLFRKKHYNSVEISMNYGVNIGLPMEDDVENWPFYARIVDGNDTYVVRIYSLTLGYQGTGPKNFAEILDHFGIEYDEEDIFTKKSMNPYGFIILRYNMY